ncbi:MAG TPA: ATP-grasp domain-containing protein [Kineosporiaceae bacterium]|nr:ATP-grasp domain-containing protein [Kineosporiaceae bacterium]
MLLLMPGDPMRPRKVDPHFEPEAEAARQAGHRVAVVDHHALTSPGGTVAAVSGVPLIPKMRSGEGFPSDGEEIRDAVYRGWMLRSEQYREFAGALAERGVVLRTTAAEYQQAHELPGWYPALSGLTPPSVWTAGSSRADFDRCRHELGSGPVVLRDHAKSMKHYWDEAAFIPEIAAADAAWRVAVRFLELRDDDFVGGFVLRRYEDFDTSEVRTWWVAGRCVLIDAHPDTPHQAPPGDLDLSAATSAVAQLRLPFVTVDFAHRSDGTWRVVELGDGQVSDRPTTLAPHGLIAALASPVPVQAAD